MDRVFLADGRSQSLFVECGSKPCSAAHEGDQGPAKSFVDFGWHPLQIAGSRRGKASANG